MMCFFCRNPATHEVSLPDRNKRGSNLNECGYSWRPVCLTHATLYRQDGGNELWLRVLPDTEPGLASCGEAV